MCLYSSLTAGCLWYPLRSLHLLMSCLKQLHHLHRGQCRWRWLSVLFAMTESCLGLQHSQMVQSSCQPRLRSLSHLMTLRCFGCSVCMYLYFHPTTQAPMMELVPHRFGCLCCLRCPWILVRLVHCLSALGCPQDTVCRCLEHSHVQQGRQGRLRLLSVALFLRWSHLVESTSLGCVRQTPRLVHSLRLLTLRCRQSPCTGMNQGCFRSPRSLLRMAVCKQQIRRGRHAMLCIHWLLCCQWTV
eukprot:31231_6